MLNADSMAWLMLILPPLAPWLAPFTTHSVGALTMTHAGGESAGAPRRTRSTVTRLSTWSQNSCCLFRLPHMSLSLCQPAAPAGGTPAVSGRRWWGRGRCGGWRACGARGTTAFRPAIRAGDPRRAATPGLPQLYRSCYASAPLTLTGGARPPIALWSLQHPQHSRQHQLQGEDVGFGDGERGDFNPVLEPLPPGGWQMLHKAPQ